MSKSESLVGRTFDEDDDRVKGTIAIRCKAIVDDIPAGMWVVVREGVHSSGAQFLNNALGNEYEFRIRTIDGVRCVLGRKIPAGE